MSSAINPNHSSPLSSYNSASNQGSETLIGHIIKTAFNIIEEASQSADKRTLEQINATVPTPSYVPNQNQSFDPFLLLVGAAGIGVTFMASAMVGVLIFSNKKEREELLNNRDLTLTWNKN